MVAIGIDLNTTYSCVEVFKMERQKLCERSRNRTTPPVAFQTKKVNWGPMQKISGKIRNTVHDIKRLLGQNTFEVQDDKKLWTFNVIDDGNNKPKLRWSIRVRK